MKKVIVVFCMLVGLAGVCRGQQKATVQIISDVETQVAIRGSVDGAFQHLHVSDKFRVSPNISITYTPKINEHNSFQINFDNARCFLWLLPDDNVTIHYTNDKITFTGSNAAGHKYHDENWNGTNGFIEQLRQMALTTDDYSRIEADFIERFVVPTISDIDLMLLNNSISNSFANTIKFDITEYQYSSLWKTLRQTSRNKKLNDEQQAQINGVIEHLYNRYSTYDDEKNLRYYLGANYLEAKYRYMFDHLNDNARTALYGNYNPETFGPYAQWLLAPKSVQTALFFSAILAEYSLGFNSMDIPALLSYMKDIAPSSEAIEILTPIVAEHQKGAIVDSAQYIEDEINTLAEISNISELVGNYCLIDLWASWCVPCLQQFQYTDELHKLVAKYKNLKQVYITIDEPSAEKQWKKLINKFNLSGFHLLANKNLQKDIKARIFNNESIIIPRYILLSPSGEIICSTMPRPSEMNKLADTLSSYIKQ